MLSAIKKFGNSVGVLIPKPMLQELAAQAGDSIDIRIEEGRLIIERLGKPARSGWGADAERVATAGEPGLAWPEFGNLDDAKLEW